MRPRPFVVFSFVDGKWVKGKGRYASVESAAKTCDFWVESGAVADARVMEQTAQGVWATRHRFPEPQIKRTARRPAGAPPGDQEADG